MKVKKFELIVDNDLIPMIGGQYEYGAMDTIIKLQLVMRHDEYIDYSTDPYSNYILKYRGLIYKFRIMDIESGFERFTDRERIEEEYTYNITGKVLPESFSDKEISDKLLYPVIEKCQG